MLLRRVALASALFTAACTPLNKQTTSVAGPPVRITNQIPFDVAACQGPQGQLPPATDPNILVGALVAARPNVMECLVAPTSRGAEAKTRVLLKARATDQNVERTVSGENLTPEGQACLQKALETAVPLTPLPKDAAPVSAEVEFAHEQGRSLSVTFGTNEGSDYSGAVRLGQAQWCGCYAPFTAQVPPQLEATVKLVKTQATPASVTFKPAGSPEADALAACLQQKMMALPVTLATTDTLEFTRVFPHFHSRATTLAAGMSPELRFFQTELSRNQRAADVQIAVGVRTSAAEAYDNAFVKLQRKSKDRKLAEEVAARCTALVDANAKWVASIETQLQTDQQSLTIAQELKAKDAATWTPMETGAQDSIARTQTDLTNAKNQATADQVCAQK